MFCNVVNAFSAINLKLDYVISVIIVTLVQLASITKVS